MRTALPKSKPWKELLRDGFHQVRAAGGLFALDITYSNRRDGRQISCHYQLMWTNRLAATTVSGRLVSDHGGLIRTGPDSTTVRAVKDALNELRQLRKRSAKNQGVAA